LTDLTGDFSHRAVIEVYRLPDIRRNPQRYLDPAAGARPDVLDSTDIARVGHDHHQRVTDNIHRDERMLAGHFLRHELDGIGLDDVPLEVDEGNVEEYTLDRGQVLGPDITFTHQYLAEGTTPGTLYLQSPGKLFRSNQPLLEKHLPEVFPGRLAQVTTLLTGLTAGCPYVPAARQPAG